MSLNFNDFNPNKNVSSRLLTADELFKAITAMHQFKTNLLRSIKNVNEIIYKCQSCKIVVYGINVKPKFMLCPICAEHLN